MILDFVAIDTETMMVGPGHVPVELGAVRYRGGVETARFSSLACPGCALSVVTQRITGIDPAEVEAAPPLAEVLPAFLAFVGDDPVIGHNLAFDLRAIENGCRLAGLRPPAFALVCDTMEMARTAFSHCSLANCARWLGVPQEEAHRAVSDSATTAAVYLALQAELMPKKPNIPHIPKSVDPASVEPNGDALDGVVCCVTGDRFGSYSRREVEQLILSQGGTVKGSVSKKVRYLIAGEYEGYPPGYQSTKMLRARELRAAGVEIDTVTMDEFLVLMAVHQLDGGF